MSLDIPPGDDPEIVVFRAWRSGDHDVIAIFPTMAADYTGNLCGCFEHTGEHSAAWPWGIMQQTRPAQPNAYAELKHELEQRGYVLDVRKRITCEMQSKRQRQARKWAEEAKVSG